MSKRPLVLMWDNFGPLHIDRLNAVARAFSHEREIIGIELCGRSDTYDWTTGGEGRFCKITLFVDKDLANLGTIELYRALAECSRKLSKADYILCHFDVAGVFLAALSLRLKGNRVYTMGCSKFDDRLRTAPREFFKTLFLKPYQGGLASGMRSISFFQFLGVPADKVFGEYNTVSQDRIRNMAGLPPMSQKDSREGISFEERDFISVARLVPKKNLTMLLRAYAIYSDRVAAPRRLHLLGSGPEEVGLRALAKELRIAERVQFHGFVQTDAVARQMAQSLALLLPSYEEQFGNVVPEAQALGLPVILSDNAGARDNLVRTAQSGFIIEPDNPEGLAWYMEQIATDSALWQRLRDGAFRIAPQGDVERFAEGIGKLISASPRIEGKNGVSA